MFVCHCLVPVVMVMVMFLEGNVFVAFIIIL